MTLKAAQLTELLGITSKQLGQFVRDGMPTSGLAQFNEDDVREWLIDNGLAREVAPTVYQTRTAIAKALGVGEATISRWQKDESFPGRPGTAGLRDGYYPLEDIERWLGSKGNGKAGSVRGELEQLKVAMATLDVVERLGSVESVDVVRDYYARICARSKARLIDCSDEIDANLPPDIDDDIREDIRQRIESTITKVCRELEQLHYDDSDDLTAAEAEQRERAIDDG